MQLFFIVIFVCVTLTVSSLSDEADERRENYELPAVQNEYSLYPDADSDHSLITCYTDMIFRNSSAKVVLYSSLSGNRVHSGSQERYGPNAFTQQDIFPLGVVSELFLDVLAMHMSIRNLLPFSKDGLIPRQVLPPALQQNDILVNPKHPGVPISLDHLLQHLSGLNEMGFNEATQVVPIRRYTYQDSIEVSTLEEYVEDLFFDYGDDIWRDVTPGTSTSFYFSRNNIALATYVLNRILANNTYTKDTTPNVTTYLMVHILPQLGMRSTFFLNRKGDLPALNYPENLKEFNMLQYQSVQTVWSNGSLVNMIPIHPVYTADYMLYTSSEDLFSLIRALLDNEGYFSEEGDNLRQNPININPTTDFPDPIQQHQRAIKQRSVGFYGINIHTLCMDSYSDCNTTLPLNNVSSVGLIASNTCNEIVASCDDFVGCFLSLTFTSCLGGDYDPVKAAKTRIPMPEVPPMEYSSAENKLNYLLLFLGTVGVIAATFFVSYVADHVIHPAPPTQPILPEPERDFPVESNEDDTRYSSYTSSSCSSSSVSSDNGEDQHERWTAENAPSVFPTAGTSRMEFDGRRQREHLLESHPEDREGGFTNEFSPFSVTPMREREDTMDIQPSEAFRRDSRNARSTPTSHGAVAPISHSPVETPPRNTSFSAPKTPENPVLPLAFSTSEPRHINLYNS